MPKLKKKTTEQRNLEIRQLMKENRNSEDIYEQEQEQEKIYKTRKGENASFTEEESFQQKQTKKKESK